jgi:hypothetical protein
VARALGISYKTFRRWMNAGKKYPDGLYGQFRQVVEVSEATFKTRAVGVAGRGAEQTERAMNIRDRIKELRRVPANELKPSPLNWRTHPKEQLNALRGVLAEIGFAGAALGRELPDGTVELIDGHARAEVSGTAPVPVLILDVSEAEARKILATFDPVGALAGADAQKLDALLRDVVTADESVALMLEELARDNGIIPNLRPPGGGDEIAPAAARAKPRDLWEIGGIHRLLVADCNDSAQTCRLELPAAHVTILDPPYEAADRVWMPHLTDPCILFGQGKHLRAVPPALYRFERVVDKVTAHRSATVQVGHMHAFVVQVGSEKRLPATPTTYPSIVRHEARPDHPHEKPASLVYDHLVAWTPPGPVWEPFAGSGAGLIASARAGRTWYGCELNPEYADVILARAEAEGLSVVLMK